MKRNILNSAVLITSLFLGKVVIAQKVDIVNHPLVQDSKDVTSPYNQLGSSLELKTKEQDPSIKFEVLPSSSVIPLLRADNLENIEAFLYMQNRSLQQPAVNGGFPTNIDPLRGDYFPEYNSVKLFEFKFGK
jgi:hypothetical protein